VLDQPKPLLQTRPLFLLGARPQRLLIGLPV